MDDHVRGNSLQRATSGVSRWSGGGQRGRTPTTRHRSKGRLEPVAAQQFGHSAISCQGSGTNGMTEARLAELDALERRNTDIADRTSNRRGQLPLPADSCATPSGMNSSSCCLVGSIGAALEMAEP